MTRVNTEFKLFIKISIYFVRINISTDIWSRKTKQHEEITISPINFWNVFDNVKYCFCPRSTKAIRY